MPLGNAKPLKMEGSLVPYATTVWDFINRAMPWTTPGTMPPDEVYAVTAYVLFSTTSSRRTTCWMRRRCRKVRMPNRDSFVGVELDWKPGQRRPLGHYPG